MSKARQVLRAVARFKREFLEEALPPQRQSHTYGPNPRAATDVSPALPVSSG